MKARVISVFITVLFVVSMAFTLVQCDHDGMARVTIHIQNEAYAGNHDSIIDKLLNLFSTSLYAMDDWGTDHTNGIITLTISGPDIQTIETTIPPTLTSFNTEVPAGTQRTFRLVYDNEGQYNVHKTYGGIETVTLAPGDNDVNITMIPMTEINSAYLSQDGIGVTWYNINSATAIVSGYNLYRSTSENGTYNKVNQQSLITLAEFNDVATTPPTLTIDETYYYRVSAVTLDEREGLLSDAFSRLYNP